jgi:CheY-like chemotaxis protein
MGSAPKAGTPLRVLAVDDSADTASSLAMLLRLWGHEARTARDGPAALAAAAEFAPEVALLDLGLPRMDGYELGRRLRELPGLGRLLLVALTGYADAEYRRRSAAAGFAFHLVKPPDPSELEGVFAKLAGERGKG